MNKLVALAIALLAPLAALAAWTPVGPGLDSLALAGARPTHLAMPGEGSSASAAGGAPRVLVVADESPEGLRFIDPDAGVELGTLSLPYQPVALAVDSAGGGAYVLTDDESLHVVDIATRTLLATFAVGGNPKALLLREAAGQVVEVLVAQKGPDRVTGIDPANGAVLRSVALDRNPATLAWAAGGTRVLVGAKSGKLYTLDAADLSILATAQIGDEIRHLSWWDAGARAVVVHKRTDGVSLVDVATGQVSAFVALDGDPERSAVDPATTRAYVTTHDDFSINRVDLGAQALDGRYALPEKAAGVVFDALSGTLFVSQRGDRRLLRLNPAQASLISILTLNKRLRDVAVNNVTHEAVAVADKADELTRIKLSDLSTAVVALPARPRFVAVDSVLNLAVVGHKNKTLRFVDTAQTPPVLLPDTVTLADEPDSLAVDSTRNLTLALSDTKRKLHFVSNTSRMLLGTLSLAEDADALALHPGRGLAYVLTDKKKLLLVNLDTRTVAQTIGLEFRGNAIAVDPARDRAVLTTDRDDKAYVLDLASLTPAVTNLVEASFAQVHVLPRKPGAVKIQPDSGLAVVASRESNALSGIRLDEGTLSSSFVSLDKPFALAISSRYNKALVLGAEKDDVSFVQLPNPVPVLATLTPSVATAGSPMITLAVTGQRFIDASRVYFGAIALVTRWISHTSLEADVPAALLAAPGSVNVTVQNPPPEGGTSNALPFTVTGPPVLTAIVPDSALADGQPKALTLSGQNFAGGAGVLFGAVLLPANVLSSTSLSVTVPGTQTVIPGTVQVAVLNPGSQVSNALPFTLTPALAIAAISPASGPIGTLVTISGSGFDPVPANNLLVFRGINNTTVPGVALSATPTQITVRVPPLAETGPITLTNSQGTVQSPVFTVAREQDFQLVASPANLTAYQGTSNSAQVQVSSTGTSAFTGLVTVTVQGLPAGVTATVSPAPTLSAFQTGSIAFTATGGAAPGAYPVTLQGMFLEGGQPFVRSAGLNLTVGASAGVTGVKGRFVTPERQGIAGVIVRADTTQNPQPQTTTDAAGNFVLTGLPAGEVTFRFDATPAHPLYPIWPYTTTVVANQIAVISDWTINPPPPDERFTPINNAAQTQLITDERYPGLQITLPAGASIIGWDGVPKTRIAVERLMPDKLPVTPPPVPIRESYQLYFGTPMGGIPSQPIPIALPNVAELEPGEQTEIWYFDGSPMGGSGEWKLAGLGTVGPDGKTVASNPGVGIPRFCGVCGLVSLSCPLPPNPPQPPPGPSCTGGNPVDLFTGQELARTGGLSCSGLTPIHTGLKYNPVDAFNGRAGTFGSFGLGWTSDYDIAFLPFQGPQKRVIMPGGQFVNFVDDGSGSYKPVDDPNFDGAVIQATNAAANEWELTFKHGIKWRFKPFAGVTGVIRGGPPTFVTEMVDTAGNVLPITRQSNGRITSIGDQNRNVVMTYGANGFVSDVRDTANRVTHYTYTPTNRIATITDADNKVTSYTYVDDNEIAPAAACVGTQPTMGERIKSIQYPGRPNPTINHYGSARRVLRQLGYDGLETKFSYKVTGACVTHVSTPSVRCTANCPDVDSWDNFSAGWRFHGGRVIGVTVVRPDGSSSSTSFTSRGRPAESINTQGQPITAKYDAFNRLTDYTDAVGRTWKYVYDGKGNVVQEVDPLGRVVDMTYDAKWNSVTSVTRYLASGTPVVTQYQFDPTTGKQIRVTDPLGNSVISAYNGKGQLQQVTAPLDRITQFGFNAAGDLVSVKDPMQNEATLETDGAGRNVAKTDPLRATTRITYSGTSDVLKITDALGQETRFAIDDAGRISGVINPLDNQVEGYVYDSNDRLAQNTDALDKFIEYQYDSLGRVTTVIDRKGQVSTYTYDVAGRVTRIDFADGARLLTYDAVGRVTSVEETGAAGSSRVSYTYNAGDQLIREEQSAAGVTTTIEHEYDALSRRTKRTVNGSDVTTYAYDNAGRLTSVGYRGEVTGYTWDAANRLTMKTLPNGVTVDYEYDLNDRITRIIYKGANGSVIEDLVYAYDAAGRRVSRTSLGASSHSDTPFTASYNAADRMTSITINPNSVPTFDPPVATTYSLTYDDNGNLVQKQNNADPNDNTLYTWDARNRLIGIASPTGQSTFKYDALNRRVEKTIGGETLRYAYDGPQAVLEIASSQTTTILAGLTVDEVIARYSQTGNSYYLQDALLSVIAQTNDVGAVTNYYSYSPYGETQVLGPDGGNAIQFTGREYDQTGLYYYRARYYDPLIKRFVSEDPIGVVGGLNVYGYVGGDPINMIDPTGNASTCYSAGPGCSGAGPGNFPGNGIIKTPPGGGCLVAVWHGGYIIRWDKCPAPTPIPPTPPGDPDCPPPPPPAPPSQPGDGPGSSVPSGGTPPSGGKPPSGTHCNEDLLKQCINRAGGDFVVNTGLHLAGEKLAFGALHLGIHVAWGAAVAAAAAIPIAVGTAVAVTVTTSFGLLNYGLDVKTCELIHCW